MNLNLRAPLFFKKIGELPGEAPENAEFLLCYELDPAEARSIEPDRERLLGALLFVGEAEAVQATHREISLPAGHYFFSQIRGDHALGRDEWLDMAIENQKDGLWERNKLGNELYVRFLHEDNAFVTQVFRVISD
ncbi:MAG: hypothetical protein FWC01_08075 [Treponema sp.]|nr:hypothetical protein [Treponema sp.]MCL2237883.1 hypothetical protein [Treponema sp.]